MTFLTIVFVTGISGVHLHTALVRTPYFPVRSKYWNELFYIYRLP